MLRSWLGGWALIILFLQAACATGVPRGSLPSPAPREFVPLTPSSDFLPVQMSDTEFHEAFNQLVLEVPLPVAPRPSKPLAGRLMRVSWRPAHAHGASVEGGYARLCERRGTPGDCFSFLGGGAHDTSLSDGDRFTLGLILALSPAVEAATGVLQDFSAYALTVLLTGLSLYLAVLMAPEPISKGVALAMTLFLWGYLGMELWGLLSATRQLWDETKVARTFHEVHEASERYGQVLGPNTVRVLILLATWKAGAKGNQAMAGGGLPRFSQAVQNAAIAGRFRLPTAAAEAEAVSVVEGRLVLTLPAGSAAILAMQKQGDGDDGHIHHICTNKNDKSDANGGPWTPLFRELFKRAGLTLEDAANTVRLKGHKGPHPEAYHQHVYNRVKDAMKLCRGLQQCKEELTAALRKLADEIVTEGSPLNKLVTQTH